MHSSLCSATSPVIAPRRACTATREPPLPSEARESPRAATEAQQSQTKEQYLKPKQSPKTCRSPQDNSYFLPSVMRPKIHTHAHLPVTQTAKGTRTHLPAGGDPGEERTLSSRNTTASRRGHTPVCPMMRREPRDPPTAPWHLGGAAHLSAAVSAASLASPGCGSDGSSRIRCTCCSISRGLSSRPSW